MSSAQEHEGSEDVTDFLRRIKELEDRRAREDTERARKLEQDILQGRKQREARRAERARSLSPEKSSPIASPRSMNSPNAGAKPELANSSLGDYSAPRTVATSMASRVEEPLPLSVDDATPPPLPARTSTLSWQQRPSSMQVARSLSARSQDSRSSATSINPANQIEPIEVGSTLSRTQIAQNLASKDPSWFRQTPDRGTGSAAFRRNIPDPEAYQNDNIKKRELNGLSSKPLTHINSSPTALTDKDTSIDDQLTSSKAVDKNELLVSNNQIAADQIISSPASFPSDIQQSGSVYPTSFEDQAFPSQTADRPPSPTKGLGGFVQSAMLRRSESMSKRWSAQVVQHPSKGPSSSLSNTSSSVAASQSDTAETNSAQTGVTRDATTPKLDLDRSVAQPNPFNRPQTPSASIDTSKSRYAEASLATSPTKKWSPTKSTWLESALKKPDSPTPKYTQPQPAWKTQISKTKQEKVNKDQPLPTFSSENKHSSDSEQTVAQVDSSNSAADNSPPLPSPKPQSLAGTSINKSTDASRTQLTSKPDPPTTSKPVTLSKTDFRSHLKPATSQPDDSVAAELEFRSAFGKLKRTQAEKYVAPDELKNNILRGKAALNLTDGPQKPQRHDELKESLVKQREAMKAKSQDINTRAPDPAAQRKVSLPEAIAHKKAMDKHATGAEPQTISKPRTVVHESRDKLNKSVKPVTQTSSDPQHQTQPNFNINLANIIARGPRQVPNEKPLSSNTPSTDNNAGGEHIPSPTQPRQLQHMTKARAKGPKRRLPNPEIPTTQGLSDNTSAQIPVKSSADIQSRQLDQTESIQNPSTKLKADPETRFSSHRPHIPPKSPQLKREIESTPFKDFSKSESTTDQRNSQTYAQLKEDLMQDPPITSGRSVYVSPASPKSKQSQGWGKDATSTQTTAVTGLMGSQSRPHHIHRETNTTPRKLPLNDASSSRVNSSLPADLSPSSKLDQKLSQVSTKPSQILQSTDAEKTFAEFFGTLPSPLQQLDVDTNKIVLSNPMDTGKITTLHKQVRELAHDGKLISRGQQEEHVLFSNRMYLCTHGFEDSQGSRKTEVYLWIGHLVGDAAVEDAQLFARKAAKDAGGPLVLLRQGKETPALFQALGGILVTRNGDSKDSSRSYMLCGRKYLGHLAFDEVPFSASSLCSGFAYIISSTAGYLYLWKGVGCSTEELSAARLLSMDMGSLGDVVEVEDGKEPSAFFDMFPSGEQTVARSATHWKLKAAHDNYANRLYQIEHNERPLSRQNSGSNGIWNLVRRGSQTDLKSSKQTQIREMSPFAQSDLKTENIYVLDAFFELYIILGSKSNTKPEAFAAALLFAEEYAILAASAGNRPHVPVATVIIEGAPKDMKRVFRHWDDRLVSVPTEASVKRGKSLKIMPLPKALEALRSG